MPLADSKKNKKRLYESKNVRNRCVKLDDKYHTTPVTFMGGK